MALAPALVTQPHLHCLALGWKPWQEQAQSQAVQAEAQADASLALVGASVEPLLLTPPGRGSNLYLSVGLLAIHLAVSVLLHSPTITTPDLAGKDIASQNL